MRSKEKSMQVKTQINLLEGKKFRSHFKKACDGDQGFCYISQYYYYY